METTPEPLAVPSALHPDLAALVPQLTGPSPQEQPPAEARRRFAALLESGLAGAPEVAVEELDLRGGLSARCYTPTRPQGGTIVFFHGGGWTVGSVEAHDGLARRIADRTSAVVVSVEYRLAPEHRFPSAVADAVLATRWALAQERELGGNPRRVAVAGDSAGGNLAAVVCQQLRDARGAQPAAQLLLYPVVAGRADQPSAQEFGALPFLTLAEMGWYTRQYVPRGTGSDPRLSPLDGDLAGLPPALVVTAGCDPLHDSGVAYAEGLRAAGSPAELLDLPDMPHGFAHLPALAPAAAAALDRVLDRATTLLQPGGSR